MRVKERREEDVFYPRSPSHSVFVLTLASVMQIDKVIFTRLVVINDLPCVLRGTVAFE